MPRIKKLWVPANEGNIKIGVKVRVSPRVDYPAFGWGGVSHDDVGVVVLQHEKIYNIDLWVSFPNHSAWNAKYEDLEVYCAEN